MASSSNNRQPTANKGGSSSIATPANSVSIDSFITNDSSSDLRKGNIGIFGSSDVGPQHSGANSSDPNGATAQSSSGGTGYKRKSQDGGSMFGNLSNLKRDSADQGVSQRKSSMSDQSAQPGVIGQMWNNFTKGSGTGK